ncbi:MAG: zinc ribbon domain-containing protein [Rivularia sp. (in: cyanobacteria)]
MTVTVPTQNTSQNYSNCGPEVQRSLSTGTRIYPHCGFIEDRDFKAHVNILKN